MDKLRNQPPAAVAKAAFVVAFCLLAVASLGPAPVAAVGYAGAALAVVVSAVAAWRRPTSEAQTA